MKRSAFTLLELLVSSLLTAMLMIALLSVLRSSLQTTGQVDRLQVTTASTTMLDDQLKRDLSNCRGLQVEPNQLLLHGFLASDPGGMPNYQPAFVGYRIKPAGLVRWLSLDGKTADEQLVWAGATGLQVQTDVIEGDQDINDQVELQRTGGLPAAPTTISVFVLGQTRQLITSFTISHHQEMVQ